jgi:hypothetical protein
LSEQRNPEELAIRYLLGGLSEGERTTIEERYFRDDKEFKELEIAEGELIDRYVRKELSATDQRQFEKMLRTSPRLVERVEFARILARQVPSPAPQQVDPEPAPEDVQSKNDKNQKFSWRDLFGPKLVLPPSVRVALVAPLALLLMMSVALVLVSKKLQTQSGRLAAEQQRLNDLEKQLAEQKGKSDQLDAAVRQSNLEKEELDKLLAYHQQLTELRQQSPVSPFLFELNPGGGTTRGGGGGGKTTVPIPRGTQVVVLNLNVENGKYSLYLASLQDINHEPIMPQRQIRPVRRDGRNVIPFRVPASKLRPGRSYSIHVDGLIASGEPEDFNDYPFRVTSR